MIPHRISIKYFVNDPAAVDLDMFIPIFHGWIQRDAITDVLLVDVADYKHVPDGPGIMLIGHEVDYSIDMVSGRPGLLYSRKRDLPETLDAALQLALNQSLTAVHLIEQEATLNGTVSMGLGEIELTVLDPLRASNSAETFDTLADTINTTFSTYFGQAVMVERIENDPRLALQIRITIPTPPALADIAQT